MSETPKRANLMLLATEKYIMFVQAVEPRAYNGLELALRFPQVHPMLDELPFVCLRASVSSISTPCETKSPRSPSLFLQVASPRLVGGVAGWTGLPPHSRKAGGHSLWEAIVLPPESRKCRYLHVSGEENARIGSASGLRKMRMDQQPSQEVCKTIYDQTSICILTFVIKMI